LPLAKIRALRQVCVTIWQKSFLWTQWEIEIQQQAWFSSCGIHRKAACPEIRFLVTVFDQAKNPSPKIFEARRDTMMPLPILVYEKSQPSSRATHAIRPLRFKPRFFVSNESSYLLGHLVWPLESRTEAAFCLCGRCLQFAFDILCT
jgi:hypothetical protein